MIGYLTSFLAGASAHRASPASGRKMASVPAACCNNRRICGKLQTDGKGPVCGGKNMTVRVWCLAVLACVAVPSARGEAPALERYSYEEPHMGTRFGLLFYAPDEETANKASKADFARVAELNSIMSDYLATSEWMRLCAKAVGGAVEVSDDLFFVLKRAGEVSKQSDGAFDVTVGPVVRLWRLARKTRRLPDAEKLKAARALVGWKMVELDEKQQTVKLKKAGMQLDLGGIAKGYAADEVLKVLKKFGITT